MEIMNFKGSLFPISREAWKVLESSCRDLGGSTGLAYQSQNTVMCEGCGEDTETASREEKAELSHCAKTR